MKKLLALTTSVLGLLALSSTASKAQDLGFTITIGPGYYYQGDRCAPPYWHYRPSYYPRYNYYYQPAYPPAYYYDYYRGSHHCRHWQDDD